MPSPRDMGITATRTVLFAPVVGNLNRSKGTSGTPGKAYTNSVPGQHSLYSGGQHTLAVYTKCVVPEGLRALVMWVSFNFHNAQICIAALIVHYLTRRSWKG